MNTGSIKSPPHAVPPAHALPGWRLVAPAGTYRFQGALQVSQWWAEPQAGAECAAPPAADSVAGSRYLVDLLPITQAVLHETEFCLWRETALWRQMFPQEGYVEVVEVLATDGWEALVARLPAGLKPVLLPPAADGSRAVDPALGRSLPERLAVPLIRRMVDLMVFLLERARGIGPAPTPLELLAGLFFFPDLTSPRLKWASPYVALPCAPDQHGRRPAGGCLATITAAVLTGRVDAALSGAGLVAIRPGLTTQLPAWLDALQRYDGSGAPATLLTQFDQAIAQINTNVVSDMYRPLEGALPGSG